MAINLPDGLKKGIFTAGGVLPELANVKLVEEGNIHLTLKFLGEVDEKRLKEIIPVLGGVKFSGFGIKLKGIGVFPTPKFVRVVWVGVEDGFDEVTNIQKRVDVELEKLGFPKDEKFHPHATIARVKLLKSREAFSRFLEENRGVEFGSFKAESFDLMESRLSPVGPEYKVLERFK